MRLRSREFFYTIGYVIEPLTDGALGKRIGQAIQAAEMTQRSVAEATGMDETALSKVVAGHRRVSSLELARLSEVLHVDVMALLGGWQGPVTTRGEQAAARVRHAAELDALLTDHGYPPRADHRYPATLLDRAIEAWLAGHISIRPIAGLLEVDADELGALLPARHPQASPVMVGQSWLAAFGYCSPDCDHARGRHTPRKEASGGDTG